MPPSSSGTPQSAVAPPIWYLALCAAGGVMGLTVLTPIVPLIRADLGVSDTAVQQLLTSYLIAIAIGQLIWGPLSDWAGRRPVLLLGAVLFSIGSAAVVWFDAINMLIVFRFIQGFGAAACMAMARAMINDVYVRDEAARQMSTIGMVLAVAPAMSLAFSGWLAQTSGWKSTIVLLLFCGLLLFYFGYRFARETHLNKHARIDAAAVLAAYRSVATNPLFVFWTLASGMQVGMFFCLNAFLAYQYQRNGYSLAEFGMWFALTPLSYLLGNACNKNWLVARGIERAALTGCIGSLISSLSMLVTQSLGFTHALSLALPCSLFGFCNGIIVANATVGAIAAAAEHRGTATGVTGAWQMASGGIAGALIVAIGGAQNFTTAISVVIAMAGISVTSMLYVFRHRQQP